LGNYIGFLAGCFEAFGLILYTSAGTLFFGEIMTKVFETDKSFEPLYWLLVYVLSVLICVRGGRLFWLFNRLLAVVSVLIIVLYITSSLHFVDFKKHSEHRWFVGGVNSFLQNIVFMLWFFIGIEFVNNGTKDCNNPLNAVPFGYVAGILTLVVTGICVVWISISLQSWDSLTDELAPLNVGFCRAFSCGSRVALILSLPAVFATNFGFIFAFGRILHSLGQANILPSILGHRLVSDSTPDIALVVGSLLGFGFSCLYKFAPFPKPDLFQFCALASCFTYCTLLGSYVNFSSQFSHLTRSFRSVFGIFGAVCSFVIFLLVWISVAAFQPSQVTFYYFVGFLFLLSLYYHSVVRHHQYFCSEEQEVLFKTYVSKCKSHLLILSFDVLSHLSLSSSCSYHLSSYLSCISLSLSPHTFSQCQENFDFFLAEIDSGIDSQPHPSISSSHFSWRSPLPIIFSQWNWDRKCRRFDNQHSFWSSSHEI
jgi:ethanolamine permease